MRNQVMLSVWAALALAGCGTDVSSSLRDGAVDTRAPDTGAADTGAADTGAEDTGALPDPDTGVVAEDTGVVEDTGADVPSPDVGADVPPTDAGAGDAGPERCAAPPLCNAAPPRLAATTRWRHSVRTAIVVAQGSARHRGRDLFLREGDAQWGLAKFAYGLADDDLKDEEVEVHLLRDCARWEMLGIAITSEESTRHATVEGVEDSGGRVYFQIPTTRRLGVGWHRLHFIVRGDGSTADAYLNVLPAGARVVVTDVDGTLTEAETAAWAEVFNGPPPAANAGGAEMLTTLASRGYHVFYLTARPDWFVQRTHDWLRLRGFPRGVVHTTLGLTGATGSSAVAFKTGELRALAARVGAPPAEAFGNTDSDVAAYVDARVPAAHHYYYRYAGDVRGGRRVDDYTTLVAGFRALPLVCR